MPKLILLALVILFSAQLTLAESSCIYQDGERMIRQVEKLTDIPERYRREAKCFKAAPQGELARPEEIKLEGSVRHETSSTEIGRFELRWPRKVEALFGRTPQRALSEAARAVSRAVRKGGFPSNIEKLELDWQIVFLDETLPEKQVPAYLISNCHPGWMTPPANIYIVAQRVAAGCNKGAQSSSKVADGELARVLIHEMGHAIENQLLNGKMGGDRMQAEGFASWFEQYGSDFSPVVAKGAAREQYYSLAKASFKSDPDGPFMFNGSATDYARASMYFNAVVSRYGVRGLMDVYKVIREQQLSLIPAINERFGWSTNRLDDEVKRLLK